MGWFKRLKEGITTSTKEKKETPEGLWYKCPSCKKFTPFRIIRPISTFVQSVDTTKNRK